MCIRSPVQNDQTHTNINKATLGNGRGVILDRSEKPFYSGKLDVGPCWTILVLFQETAGFEKQHFVED